MECTQENRLVRIEKMLQEASACSGSISTRTQVIESRVDKVEDAIDEHEKAIRGYNGTPGLVGRLTADEAILGELQLALKGRGEDPGMIGTVKQIKITMDKWEDSQKITLSLVLGPA